MILKITNNFNLIISQDDYEAFLSTIHLTALVCPICGAIGLFIFYGHYKRHIVHNDFTNNCDSEIKVQRVQCKNCRSTHALLPSTFVPYSKFPYILIYYIATLNENSDMISSFEVALYTIKRLKIRIHRFWDELLPAWKTLEKYHLILESLKSTSMLFGSTHQYRSIYVLPTEL